MDVIGLSLAGAETPFGRSTRAAAIALSPPGPCRMLGTGDRVGVTTAAFANGAFSQALEFDDTHNESIVHMSSPAVAAALALSEIAPVSGRDLITAIALGNEISCRVGSVASGQFHKRGFHPTGLFATFGSAYLASKLLGLDAQQMAQAAGICGSFASGLLQCWVDGTQTKFLHPGWAAQSGITAAVLAREGTTGPAEVFEGRFGLFASHLQDATGNAGELRPHRRRSRHALGKPQFVVQAVSRRARAASLHQRDSAAAQPAWDCGRGCGAHRVPGDGVHRRHRLRADGGEVRAGVRLAWPREPAVQPRGGADARVAGQERVSRGEPAGSGDSGAGAARDIIASIPRIRGRAGSRAK